MQYQQQQYSGGGGFAAQASVEDRASFLVKTYLHLVVAIFAFVFLEVFYFVTPIADMFFQVLWQFGNLGWLAVMAGFIGVSYLADWWARSGSSRSQ